MKGTEVISESDKWHGAWQHQFPQPSVHRAFQPKAAVRVNTSQERISIYHSWGLDPLFYICGGCF